MPGNLSSGLNGSRKRLSTARRAIPPHPPLPSQIAGPPGGVRWGLQARVWCSVGLSSGLSEGPGKGRIPPYSALPAFGSREVIWLMKCLCYVRYWWTKSVFATQAHGKAGRWVALESSEFDALPLTLARVPPPPPPGESRPPKSAPGRECALAFSQPSQCGQQSSDLNFRVGAPPYHSHSLCSRLRLHLPPIVTRGTRRPDAQ